MTCRLLLALSVAGSIALPTVASSETLYGVTNYYVEGGWGYCPNVPCPKLFMVDPISKKSTMTMELGTNMAIDDIAVSRDGMIYANVYDGNLFDVGALMKLDPVRKTTAVVAPRATRAVGLEFDNRGHLYSYDPREGLSRVNLTDGTLTLIGRGSGSGIGDMAFGLDRMFALERRPEDQSAHLVTIDLGDGTTTQVGKTELPFDYFSLAFSGSKLYSSFRDRVLVLDPLTGGTLSATTSIHPFSAMGGAPAPVPLPAAAPLLIGAVVLLGALGARRRRRELRAA